MSVLREGMGRGWGLIKASHWFAVSRKNSARMYLAVPTNQCGREGRLTRVIGGEGGVSDVETAEE